MNTKASFGLNHLTEPLNKVGAFSVGMWRYWRRGQPAPDSNYIVEKLSALTDGRSNNILFRLLESRRKEAGQKLGLEGPSLVSDAGTADPGIEQVVSTLKQDGVVALPYRLKDEAVRNLYELALSCPMRTTVYGPLPEGQLPGTQTSTPITGYAASDGINLADPRYAVYEVPRALLMENPNIQLLLCDPYLLTVAARYLGVFPVVTRPDMWWDTDCVPSGLRPRPFHVDSGCLRWLKVGINLTETTLETPHFIYVKGSHNPNRTTRALTRRLARRMNLSDKEVHEICSDKVVHVTAPAGTITLADTRGIHKGEISQKGHRLILYFGLEGSAFNSIDKPIPLHTVSSELQKAMTARPFSYQFFQRTN